MVWCNYSDDRAHSDSAAGVKPPLNCVILDKYSMSHLQAAGIEIKSDYSTRLFSFRT